MKKIMLFTAAALFVFSSFPAATTQAMPRKIPNEGTIVSNPHNAVLSVFNHKGLSDMITELGTREIKDSILTCDLQEPHETWLAQGGKAETTPPGDDKNPYVKRRGHGRSKMGDAVVAKDNNSKNGENEDGEDGDGEMEEDEEFGDDSSVKYNKKLKNSSGYNENL